MEMQLTYREALLVQLMNRAVESGRLNKDSPTFTARGLTRAIAELPLVRGGRNEHDVGALLDQMGVFLIPRNSRRKTQDLLTVLPAALEAAEKELARVSEIQLPTIASHSNYTR